MPAFALALVAIHLFLPVNSLANFKGAISFSDEERRWHREGVAVVMDEAAQCLQRELDYHKQFYKQWKISPFYGDRSAFAKNIPGRRDYLRQYKGFTEQDIDFLLKNLQPTSCIGLTIKCLEKGFQAARQEPLWAKLKEFTLANDAHGGALQEGLQLLGWRLWYWNPDPAQSAIWDEEEKKRDPTNPEKIWGFHEYHWNTVNRTGMYLYNRVDDVSQLVGFGETVPSVLTEIPFFVGVAHAGYHVFPGSFGQIIEGHSMRPLHDYKTIETSPFNPLVRGGGPRGFYRSGLIAVPPVYNAWGDPRPRRKSKSVFDPFGLF